ncbi:hypothetical protein [Nocardia jiangsuensis]|uniref:Uncharacterized protein n=1 Tax=Nocardia jiangsuensis TaxID=1691563 RepID=A0ABV8E1K5_9NOCA
MLKDNLMVTDLILHAGRPWLAVTTVLVLIAVPIVVLTLLIARAGWIATGPDAARSARACAALRVLLAALRAILRCGPGAGR